MKHKLPVFFNPPKSSQRILTVIKLVIIFLLVSAPATIQAQEAVIPSGGNASGNSGSLSYSVGQVAYIMCSSEDGCITQGVQQPYEIYVEVGMKNDRGIDLFSAIYPNPVKDELILQVRDHSKPGLVYRLFDLNGYLLEKGEILNSLTSIPMGHLSSGTYLLHVTLNDKTIQTFTIIKQ
jgi:hypothetical protein